MIKLPELPYAYDALKPWIDEETMHLHHDKHHQAYVDNLNAALSGAPELSDTPVEELLADPSKLPETIRQKVVNHGGGHMNHAFFWESMTPVHDTLPEGKLAEAIDKTFGSFDQFRELFSKTAVGRFGSGWAWLVLDHQKLAVIDTSNQDSPLTAGKIPLLALDVWEHAYYVTYRNRRADYIAAWWHVVDWKNVAMRYEQAMR